jgi:hypothetical protein
MSVDRDTKRKHKNPVTACKISGDKHPDVAATLSNLAAVLEMLGKQEEAQEKFAQVILL